MLARNARRLNHKLLDIEANITGFQNFEHIEDFTSAQGAGQSGGWPPGSQNRNLGGRGYVVLFLGSGFRSRERAKPE
jgi:hypothetical protein